MPHINPFNTRNANILSAFQSLVFAEVNYALFAENIRYIDNVIRVEFPYKIFLLALWLMLRQFSTGAQNQCRNFCTI